MKIEKFEVTWKGILLRVEGEFYLYYPPTREQPEEGGYVELEAVYLQNVNVSPLLDEDDWYELEQVVYSAILKEREEARERSHDEL